MFWLWGYLTLLTSGVKHCVTITFSPFYLLLKSVLIAFLLHAHRRGGALYASRIPKFGEISQLYGAGARARRYAPKSALPLHATTDQRILFVSDVT